MSIEIMKSGIEDRTQTPWQMAIGGYPGSGKTLFASTAPNPFYLFFAENPRMKSVADRGVLHTKLVNRFDDDGLLEKSVQEQLFAVLQALRASEIECETVVIDTADELFTEMKEARRVHQGGEFSPSDWGWLGDMFREVMTAFIDLPMNVVVLFHIKKATTEDGPLVYEVALQGAAKEDFAGWFDLVGVLDTYQTADEEGNDIVRRVLLTSSSRSYPWVKDHSGFVPPRFELSEDFSGDYDRLMAYLNATVDGPARAIQGEIEEPEAPEQSESKRNVPSPEELQVKKTANATGKTEEEVMKEAVDLVVEQLDGEVVPACEQCGADTKPNIAALAREKFGKSLCKECFKKENA